MKRALLVVLAACGSSPPPVAPPPSPPKPIPDAAPAPVPDKIALGKDVFEKKGCVACHTTDGTPRVGISMAGIWGKEVTLVDGAKRTIDAAFITDALNKPMQFRRDGYPAAMPSYEGQLAAREVEALTLYIESLK